MLAVAPRVIAVACLLLALALGSASPALAGTVISFGRQAALPDSENFNGTAVTVSDGVDLGSSALAFDRVTVEDFNNDVDALHFLPNGNALFSTDTFMFSFPGVGVGDIPGTVNPGDVVEYDPVSGDYDILFSNTNFVGAGNVDAFTILSNGNILLSTKGNGNLPGLGAFLDGDLVEWDGASASLFLAEMDIFASGANNGVDALHADGNTIYFSVSTDGSGTLGSDGLAYSADSSDLFTIDAGTKVAGLFLDGENLWDGDNTRQTDAVFVPEPATALMLALGLAGLAANRRR